MSRTTGHASVADLVQSGHLKPNEKLVLRQRNKPDTHAKVTRTGSILVGGITYASPSAAARGVTGAKAAQGWDRWRVPRLDNVTLNEVRNQLNV